jgi:hypothetical protein
MGLRVLAVALAVCGLLVLPASAQEIQGGVRTATPATSTGIDLTVISDAELAAADRFQAAYPGTLSLREGSQLTRLYGRTFEMGDTPVQTADRFLSVNADLFGAEAADLVPTTRLLQSGNTLPLMYDAETGTYKFTLVYHSQYRDGIPVFRSDVRTLVKNEIGYPLVWVGSSLKRLGNFQPDTMLRSAVDPAAVAPGMVNFTAAEQVIWAGIDDKSAPPVQAVTFVADNNGSGADPQKWLYVVDAATGAVLLQESQILNTDVTGSVHGMATTLPKSAECNPEVSMVMPYAKVAIGSTVAYANASGNFTIPNGGTSPVTVTSYMSGQYFTVNAMTGSLETLTLSVTPPGPANFMHNSADTDPTIIAQVNAYVEANRVRDWVLTQNPSYPTIATQTSFPLNVNYALTCNAYYDYSSLNFYLAGGGCANSAFSNVVHHEYGHHIVECGGAQQDQYGEGVGDSVAVCIADDPILGYGFELDCDAGIRTADNTMQYPCTSDIHTCAQLLSGCVWSTRNQLHATNPVTYLATLSSLMLNSVPMHAGSGTINRAIYTDWITLDGGPTGPHHTEITNGFAAHNMVPMPPPQNDACANAIVACPGPTYTGNTGDATPDGTASCGSSSSTPDVWYKYTPGTSGSAVFSLCGSGTTYDSVLSVHTGTCPGSSQLGCDDDTGCGGSGGPSQVTATVTEGTTYLIRVSGYSSHTGAYSLTITGPACGIPESIPPTPDPMSFASDPAPTATNAITMTATTATDADSPPVQYFFDFVSGGSGGTDSAWQAATAYTDTGLTPNTGYAYRVKARDGAATPNETAYSSEASTATLIETPRGMSFGTITLSSIDVNATGTLTNLTTGSSGVYFDSSTDGGDGGINEWLQVASDSATDLSPNTMYSFAAKARNQNGVETPYGRANGAATLIETPTGVAFGAVTSDSIELNATGTLSNLNVGTSGVYFDSSTSGGDGGINAWVQTPTDTATGLSPNTSYAFQVKARNQSSVETIYSITNSVMTLASVPAVPTLSGATATTLDLDVDANGNPATTEFAVQCAGSDPPDANWDGQYVSASGQASATASWQTEAQWGTVTVRGLLSCTSYTFAVRARNSDLVETALSPGASLATAGRPGDMNNDGEVDGNDIQAFVDCMIAGGPGCSCAATSLDTFVNCLLDAGTCP